MEIKKERFILRQFNKNDLKSLVKHINNKDIAYYTSNIPFPYKKNYGIEWLNKTINEYRKKEVRKLALAIEIKGEVVGCVELKKIYKNHKSEIGYWLSKDFWGKGIMTEVIKAIVDYAFKNFDLVRIFAYVREGNPASSRVLEKCSFKKEGTLRKAAKDKNKFIDLYLYAITK